MVFGAGGDRDRKKRPIMGRVAAEWSDRIWLTSDNPRSEDPDAIIEEIARGVVPLGARAILGIPTGARRSAKPSTGVARATRS